MQSFEAVRTIVPSAEKATDVIPLCPSRVCKHSPEEIDQIFADSFRHVVITRPALHARLAFHHSLHRFPVVKLRTHWPDATRQISVFPGLAATISSLSLVKTAFANTFFFVLTF